MSMRLPGENLKNVLYAPHISEKASVLSQDNQYVFNVARDSTKQQIKKAVEKHYDVKVVSVNLLNMQGKKKRTGRNQGVRNHWKKAYVRLAEGDVIISTGSE